VVVWVGMWFGVVVFGEKIGWCVGVAMVWYAWCESSWGRKDVARPERGGVVV
jgi:hypothetical protein